MKKIAILVPVLLAFAASEAFADPSKRRPSTLDLKARTQAGAQVHNNRARADVQASTRTDAAARAQGALENVNTRAQGEVRGAAQAGAEARTEAGARAEAAAQAGERTQGAVVTRTETGVIVEQNVTLGNGGELTRSMTVSNDTEAGVHTRTVEGTLPNGNSYSSEKVITRTEDGNIIESSMTTPSGKTVETQVSAEASVETGDNE